MPNPSTRHNFNAVVDPSELADYYLPAFKQCVQQGNVQGIMCSYNAVNGVRALEIVALFGGLDAG